MLRREYQSSLIVLEQRGSVCTSFVVVGIKSHSCSNPRTFPLLLNKSKQAPLCLIWVCSVQRLKGGGTKAIYTIPHYVPPTFPGAPNTISITPHLLSLLVPQQHILLLFPTDVFAPYPPRDLTYFLKMAMRLLSISPNILVCGPDFACGPLLPHRCRKSRPESVRIISNLSLAHCGSGMQYGQ